MLKERATMFIEYGEEATRRMAGRGPYTDAEKVAMNEIWESWTPENGTLLMWVMKHANKLPDRHGNNIVKAIEATYGKEKIQAVKQTKRQNAQESNQSHTVGAAIMAHGENGKNELVQAENANSVGEKEMPLGTFPQRREPSNLEPPKPVAAAQNVRNLQVVETTHTEPPVITPDVDTDKHLGEADVIAGVQMSDGPTIEPPVADSKETDKPIVDTAEAAKLDRGVSATVDGEQAAEMLYLAIGELRKVRADREALEIKERELEATVKDSLSKVQSLIGGFAS